MSGWARGWGATARTVLFCCWGRWCQVAEAAAVSSTSGWSTCAAAIIILSSPPLGKEHGTKSSRWTGREFLFESLPQLLPVFLFPTTYPYTFMYDHINAISPDAWEDVKLETAHMWPRFPISAYLYMSGCRNRPFSSPFKLPSTQCCLFVFLGGAHVGFIIQKTYAEEHLDKCTDVTLLLNASQSAATEPLYESGLLTWGSLSHSCPKRGTDRLSMRVTCVLS